MNRIDFRPMGARSAYVWPVGTGVLALAMAGYIAGTDPENRIYALVVVLMVAFFVYLCVRSKQWLEVAEDGTTLVQRRAFVTRRVRLDDASEVFLRANNGGSAQLVAHGPGGKAVASLLMASIYAQGYQRAEVLEAIIAGLSRNRRAGARETAELLRQQLEHVRAGGPVKTAPLAVYANDLTGVIGAAGSAGAAGSLGDPK